MFSRQMFSVSKSFWFFSIAEVHSPSTWMLNVTDVSQVFQTRFNLVFRNSVDGIEDKDSFQVGLTESL